MPLTNIGQRSPNCRLQRTFQPRESTVQKCYRVLARLKGR